MFRATVFSSGDDGQYDHALPDATGAATSVGRHLPSALASVPENIGHHHHQSGLRRMALSLWRQENDHRLVRSSDAPLRHHRNRQ